MNFPFPPLYLRFDVPTCLINHNRLINGSMAITQGDKITIAVCTPAAHEYQQYAVAYVYSRLMQLIYPDHALEPMDISFSLPNTKRGERFANHYELKKFITQNDMEILTDESGNDYFCHTFLPSCVWTGDHYQTNPVGFGEVEFCGAINQLEYDATPESLRIDVAVLVNAVKFPMINTVIMGECLEWKTLPKCLGFNWNGSAIVD